MMMAMARVMKVSTVFLRNEDQVSLNINAKNLMDEAAFPIPSIISTPNRNRRHKYKHNHKSNIFIIDIV